MKKESFKVGTDKIQMEEKPSSHSDYLNQGSWKVWINDKKYPIAHGKYYEDATKEEALRYALSDREMPTHYH